MSPFFSIVIPTKNRLSLLKECLDSVHDQILQDFEVIIIDDGSEDGTVNWVNSLGNHNIKIVPNLGIERSCARNTGVSHARGEYICFIDDDDLIKASYLSDFKNAINENTDLENTIFRTNFEYFGDVKDNRVGQRGTSYAKQKYKNELEFVIKEFSGIYTFCFPKHLVANHTFDQRFYLWEDTHFLIRVLLEDAIIHQLHSANYRYRLHPEMGSKMRSPVEFEKNLENNLNAMDDILINFKDDLKSKIDLYHYGKMIAKKKLEYASQANLLKLRMKGVNLFKSSLNNGLHPSLWRNYGYYFVSFINSLK